MTAARPEAATDLPHRAPARHLGPLVALAAFLLLGGYPLAELLAAAAAGGVATAVGSLPGTGAAAGNTLWTAAVATALAICAGLGAAWVTERSAAPGRLWLRSGMLLSLFVPSFVSALSWMRAYGPGGLTDDVVGLALPWLLGPAGVVLVIAVHASPLAYVIIAAALAARVEPDLERAARAAGATAFDAFRTVTLPLLRPALSGAAVVVFITGVNAFGIPVLLGTPSGFVTMTTRIYQDLVLAADPDLFTRAVLLSAGLAGVSVALVAGSELLGESRRQFTRTAGPVGAPSTHSRWLPATALWIYLLVTMGLPLAALVLTALTRAVGLPAVPANWTLANFSEALAGPGMTALRNSTVLAIAAATAVVLLGGLLTTVRRRRSGRVLASLVVLTFAVPGSALGVAMLLAYGRPLRNTLVLILLAYLAKFWALGHRPIAGAVDGLAPEMSWAARSSGAGAATTTRTIVLPLLGPAVAGAWMLVALFAFHELTMSVLLYGPGTHTLAVAVLNVQQLGDVTVTTALAVLLTGVVVVGAGVIWLLGRSAARLGGAR